MLVNNAGTFYKLKQEYPQIKTNKYILYGLNALNTFTNNDIDKALKEAASRMETYLFSRNKEQMQSFTKALGGDYIQDFQGLIFAAALKRMSVNNINPSETLFQRISAFKEYADDLQANKLFGVSREPNDYDFLSFILSSHDNKINNEVRFLLDLFNQHEQLKSGLITLDSIKDTNKRKWLEKIKETDSVSLESKQHKETDSIKKTADNIDYSMKREIKPIVLHTQGNKSGVELRKELKNSTKSILGQEITNKETGLSGVITGNEVNKMSSKKAVDKSIANGFTMDEHFKASENIKELFENAKLSETHADYKERENIVAVHRFKKELIIDNKEAIAKITLFEKIEGKNKIYSLELENLESASLSNLALNAEAVGQTQSVATARTEATTIASPNRNNNTTKSNKMVNEIESKVDFTPNIRVKTQNLKLENLESIFKNSNTDKVNGELFDKVFSVAKDLKVEYSNEILGNRNILGQYNAKNNKITLQDFSSETILHEMIHAVSSRAIDNPQVLKPIQKHAIKSLNRIYNRLKLDSKFKGEYALNSVKEMVAELSNPAFREKLKSRNLWQHIIDSIANLFGFRKDSSNYAKISKNLSDIIDNYDTNFTKNYENIESNFTDFAKKDTIESNLDSNQRQGMIEIKVDNAKKPIKALRDNLETTMQPQRNIPITNKNDGRVAIITNTTISKVSSEPALLKSIENGFTKEQHFAAAERLGELYENAILKEIQEDLKNGHKDVQMPRYEIEFSLSGENVKALITLKETLYGMYRGNRLYSIELQEIAKL